MNAQAEKIGDDILSLPEEEQEAVLSYVEQRRVEEAQYRITTERLDDLIENPEKGNTAEESVANVKRALGL